MMWTSLFLSLQLSVGAWDPCSVKDEEALTQVAPVDLSEMKRVLRTLRQNGSKELLVTKDPNQLDLAIEDIFKPGQKTSKLSQFFRTLHVIGEHVPFDKKLRSVDLDMAPVRESLIVGKMFPNPQFPSQIKSVQMRPVHSNSYRQYEFVVHFNDEETRLPLNQGKGFGVHLNGLCQHAKDLMFYKEFVFRTRHLETNNLLAYAIKNLELYGSFGSRGVVDVDINHVTIEKIEFFHHSNKGKVKSFVARREFKVNRHSWLLKVLSSVLPDNSVQIIDW